MFGLFHPHAENLDAMIAMQTKNKLGKSLGPPDFSGPNGKQPTSCQTSFTFIQHGQMLFVYYDILAYIYIQPAWLYMSTSIAHQEYLICLISTKT